MSLKDLKNASASRQQEQEVRTTPVRTPAKAPATAELSVQPEPPATPVSDGRTKMLGGRVPLAVHREFQQHLFRAQEIYPDLTTQDTLPVLIRLLRDDEVWQKFMAELNNQ